MTGSACMLCYPRNSPVFGFFADVHPKTRRVRHSVAGDLLHTDMIALELDDGFPPPLPPRDCQATVC
jgi:hypothetical protein